MSAILQLSIVLVVLAMSWAIRIRIRSTPGRYVATPASRTSLVRIIFPGRYTSTARQRRAWRRERLVVAYRKNTRRV